MILKTAAKSHIRHTCLIPTLQNDPPTSIFLLSMRAGAVGINLTQANHVFIMDPCLNVALEDQVKDRRIQ